MVRRVLMACVLFFSALVPGSFAGEEQLAREVFDIGLFLAARSEIPVERIGTQGPAWEERWLHQALSFLEADELEDIVRQFAGPGRWSEEGTALDVSGDKLLVTGAAPLRRAVREFLGNLWGEASRRVLVDARLVRFSGESVGRLKSEGVFTRLRDGRLDEAALRAVLAIAARPGNDLRAGTTSARPGIRTTIEQVSETTYVRDIDVEIAQGSVIGDPVVSWARQGWLLDVRTHLLAEGGVYIEALAQVGRLEEPMRRRSVEAEPLGTIDLPVCTLLRCFTAGRVAPGETLSLLLAGAKDDSLVAILITPRVSGSGGAWDGARFLPTTLLTSRTPSYLLGWGEDPGIRSSASDDEDLPLSFPPRLHLNLRPPSEDTVAYLAERIGDEVLRDEPEPFRLAPTGQGILVSGPEPLVGQARERILARERRQSRTWRAHVRFLEVEEGKERALGSLDLDAPAGREVCFESGVERSYIHDWEAEVAQEARVSDPIVSRVFGGIALNLRLDPMPVGKEVLARLVAWITDLSPEFETRRTGADLVGIIELPTLRRVVVDQEVSLRPGADPMRIEAGRAPSGRRLVLEISIGD